MGKRAGLIAVIVLLLVDWQADAPSSQAADTGELRVLIAPDHLFEEVRAIIDGATASIDIQAHTLDNADLVDAIVARQRAGVRVRVLLERGPAGEISDQDRWAAQQIEHAGGEVFFVHPAGAVAVERYAFQQARVIIVDDARVLVGSEDLDYRGMPADAKSDGTVGHRGVYLLLTGPSIIGHVKAIFAEAFDPTRSQGLVRWTAFDSTYGAPPALFQLSRASGGHSYRVVRNAPLHLAGSVPVELVRCLEQCVGEFDVLLRLVGRAGPGDTVLVEQLHEATYWVRPDDHATTTPNPRLQAYIVAARRGARVRILLDRFYDDPADPHGNSATARYVNAVALAEGLDLQARLGNPTGHGIHSGLVLASLRGIGYVHVGSLSGSEPSSASQRTVAVQMQNDDAYFFLEELFTNDWTAFDGSSDESGHRNEARPPVVPFSPAIRAPAPAPVVAPPPGSPLARADHPRIFVTRGELPGLRDRLATDYAGELQEFLDLLASPSLSDLQRSVEAPWGAINYALVAILDPAELRRRGFRLGEAIDTAPELCARSWTYTQSLLPAIARGEGQSHGAIETALSNPLQFPVIAAYDWCASRWGEAERRQVADAFVSSWATNWRGEDPLTAHGIDGMVANNKASASIHDSLGVLAFYGDAYPDRSTQAALYETFHRVWIDRVLVELQYFYAHGTGWHEGTGGYLKESVLNLGLPFALISSALGTNYFVNVPFFGQYPAFLATNIRPHGQSSDGGGRYLERWGVISGGISGIGCRGIQLVGGMLARAGDARAGVARWLHLDQYEKRSCAEEMRRHGELWVNAALYWFLFGDRGVPATPADGMVPTSLRLGLGEYVFRSDWSPAATQLIAWATPWYMYGHRPRTDAGHFTLHKFGNLIVHAGNGKSGEGLVEDFGGTNLARNVIGIRRGTEAILKFAPSKKSVDPFWLGRGIDQIELRGELIADQIGGPLDYVAFDATLAWTERADAVERELVYLRGPTNGEYVVVLDRVALRNAGDVPIWKVWTAAPADFSESGQPEASHQTGIREATGRPTVRVINQRSGLQTRYFESPDTHGALFVTPVWPTGVRMRILGGPGREFQDLDGGTPFGTPEMSDGSREYLGWGRIETWPLGRASRHVFLHVLQPGDARTIGTATPAMPLASTDGAWIGVHVGNPSNEWVLMWMKDGDRPPALPLRYRAPSGAGIRHAIFNLPANQPIRIDRVAGEVVIGWTTGAEAAVSPSGVLIVGAEP